MFFSYRIRQHSYFVLYSPTCSFHIAFVSILISYCIRQQAFSFHTALITIFIHNVFVSMLISCCIRQHPYFVLYSSACSFHTVLVSICSFHTVFVSVLISQNYGQHIGISIGCMAMQREDLPTKSGKLVGVWNTMPIRLRLLIGAVRSASGYKFRLCDSFRSVSDVHT